MTDREPRLRVVGMGFLRLPGERKRWKRAEDEARRILDAAYAVPAIPSSKEPTE